MHIQEICNNFRAINQNERCIKNFPPSEANAKGISNFKQEKTMLNKNKGKINTTII